LNQWLKFLDSYHHPSAARFNVFKMKLVLLVIVFLRDATAIIFQDGEVAQGSVHFLFFDEIVLSILPAKYFPTPEFNFTE